MNNRIKQIYSLSCLRTIIFNFKYFGIKGILFTPVFISKRTKLVRLGGKVLIDSFKRGHIRIGFGFPECVDDKYERSMWDNIGNVEFLGNTCLGKGVRISNEGTIIFGDNVNITANTKIICRKKISFGNDLLISWNCLFMDTDFHSYYDKKGVRVNCDREINIGNHVWIGCNALILKGVDIADNCIIAAGSICTKKVGDKGTIYCSNDAKKRDIYWRK